ncbi:MAG: hypothetical protein ABIJ34_05390 [archaeon]
MPLKTTQGLMQALKNAQALSRLVVKELRDSENIGEVILTPKTIEIKEHKHQGRTKREVVTGHVVSNSFWFGEQHNPVVSYVYDEYNYSEFNSRQVLKVERLNPMFRKKVYLPASITVDVKSDHLVWLLKYEGNVPSSLMHMNQHTGARRPLYETSMGAFIYYDGRIKGAEGMCAFRLDPKIDTLEKVVQSLHLHGPIAYLER